MIDDDVLRTRVQVVLKTDPQLAARWIMLRDRLQDENEKVAKFVFWKFVTEGFGPSYKKLYGVLPLTDYERVQTILRGLARWEVESGLPVRPYGQKPKDALIRDDIVIFRWSRNDFVVAFFRRTSEGVRELYGMQTDSQERAFQEALKIQKKTNKAIVYITRRNQRRTLLG